MLTKEQFLQLRAKGLSTQQIMQFDAGQKPADIAFEKKKAEEGFVSKVFRGITEPVATLAARPIQLAKALTGAETPEEQAITLPYYGKIKTPQTGKDVVADIGRAAETMALGIGGGGAKTAVKAGLGGLVRAGAKEGAIVGAKAGGLIGFGQ